MDEALNRIHRLIGTPLLTQVRVESSAGELVDESLAPKRVSDLYVDRPLTIFGRHRSPGDLLRVRVQALDATGRPWLQDLTSQTAPASLLVSMWGRARVRDLEDQYAAGQTRDTRALMARIVQVSLAAHVLSRFTAYVAVDKSEVVNPAGRPLEIVQPVEYPDGWSTATLGSGAFRAAPRGRSWSVCCDSASPPEAPDFSADLQMAEFRDARVMRLDSPPRGGTLRHLVQQLVSGWSGPAAEPSAPPPGDGTGLAADPRTDRDRELDALLDALLDEAVRSGATALRISGRRQEIRIQFLISGSSSEHAPVPRVAWDEWLEAIQRRAGIDPSSRSWPQHGELRWQGLVIPVVITRERKLETITIQIPPEMVSGQRAAEASPRPAEDRSRFWT